MRSWTLPTKPRRMTHEIGLGRHQGPFARLLELLQVLLHQRQRCDLQQQHIVCLALQTCGLGLLRTAGPLGLRRCSRVPMQVGTA